MIFEIGKINIIFAENKMDMDEKKTIEQKRDVFKAKLLRLVEIKDAMCKSDNIEETAKEYGIELSCPI